MSNEDLVTLNILKNLMEEKRDIKWDKLGISKHQFANVIHNIQEKGLIKKASIFKSGNSGEISMIFIDGAEVTEEGVRFFYNNSKGA